MSKYILSTLFVFSFLCLSTLPVLAVENQKEHVHHWELMTDDEMASHRKIMKSLDTKEERQAYRKQHHELMQARAKEQGVELAGCQHHRKGHGTGKNTKRD